MHIKAVKNCLVVHFLLLAKLSNRLRSLHIEAIQMRLVQDRIVFQLINIAILLQQKQLISRSLPIRHVKSGDHVLQIFPYT